MKAGDHEEAVSVDGR